VKLVPSKGSGSFGELADYILDKSNDAAKVEEVAFSNCPYQDTEKNLSYIKSMQDLNKTAFKILNDNYFYLKFYNLKG